MLHETGRVASLQGDAAWVICASQANCARCAEGRGCGGGLLGRLLGDRLHRVRALTNDHVLAVGDRVELGLEEAALVAGALQAYGLPLAGFIGLPVIASWLFGIGHDIALLGIGLAGLLLGMGLGRRLAVRYAGESRLQPVITRRLSAACAAD